MNKIDKWYTIIEAVDITTGELINEYELKKYIIIKKTEKYEITGNIGIKTITKECRDNGQTELQF